MKKFVCSVCGYVHEGETAPDFCPICKAPKEKFVEQAGEKSWAAEHVYLAMARVAHREGYPEIGLYWEKAAYEEAEHAAKFAELLGEFELAKKAKELNLDAIHDTVHEMARDEARHGKAFEGLLKRYFG